MNGKIVVLMNDRFAVTVKLSVPTVVPFGIVALVIRMLPLVVLNVVLVMLLSLLVESLLIQMLCPPMFKVMLLNVLFCESTWYWMNGLELKGAIP